MHQQNDLIEKDISLSLFSVVISVNQPIHFAHYLSVRCRALNIPFFLARSLKHDGFFFEDLGPSFTYTPKIQKKKSLTEFAASLKKDPPPQSSMDDLKLPTMPPPSEEEKADIILLDDSDDDDNGKASEHVKDSGALSTDNRSFEPQRVEKESAGDNDSIVIDDEDEDDDTKPPTIPSVVINFPSFADVWDLQRTPVLSTTQSTKRRECLFLTRKRIDEIRSFSSLFSCFLLISLLFYSHS